MFTNLPKNFNLLDIYDQSYFSGGQDDGYVNYIASEKILRLEFKKTVALIRQFTKYEQGLRLLEIGSAYGFFLDEARDFFSCAGIEVSEEGVLFSRNRGHQVIHGVADEDTLSSLGHFDVIVMLDVIEHLPSPRETIRLLKSHLRNDGILLIVTGDVSSMLARITGKFWRLMTPPQHTYFFSGETLSKLLKDLGFKVEYVNRPWKFVPLNLALYQLTARMGLNFSWLNKFNSIGFNVNLFDTIRIIARK
ncbi:hypothetical protein MASR2M41_13900 [Flammeovirgaceae bacterium]